METVTCKATVICEVCHSRQTLERVRFTEGEVIRMICHECEIPLVVEFRKPVDGPIEPEYSLARNPWFGQLFDGI